jgi:hypothetical protein
MTKVRVSRHFLLSNQDGDTRLGLSRGGGPTLLCHAAHQTLKPAVSSLNGSSI